jgi:hypothetical protein
MAANSTRMIFAESGSAASCTVTDPDGASVEVGSDATFDQMASEDGMDLIGTFRSTDAGDYSVECTSPAQVGPELRLGDMMGALAAGLAFLALVPLGLLTLLGLILWLVGRSRDNRAAVGATGYGYGTGQTPYPQDYGQGSGAGQGYPPGSSYPTDTPRANDGATDPYAPPPPPGPPGPEGDDRAR